MLKDDWEEFSDNDALAESSSRHFVSSLTSTGSTSGFLHPTEATPKSVVRSNMEDLITYLSANYGPMKTPLETGTPEYLKLVQILQQSSAQLDEVSNQLKPDEISRDNQQKNDLIAGVPKIDEKKMSTRVAAEKLWEGTLQLSSSVTLSAVAFFKSGEKLVGNIWPELIQVKGKVKLEAFEKYVKDLPRSRNRGLMVISVCWKEGSSDAGLTGMKEVAKGYKKSSRVGFAHLLSGTDLYICPRSDPIITILAKYGFFKGMSVIDDKPDSMIGCVVWRKNRPLKTSPNSTQPPLNSPLSIKQNKPSPESQPPESSQHNEPLTLPLTSPLTINNENSNKNVVSGVEADHNSSSNSSPLQSCDNLVKKRAFEDDDLPEFDFGKSTLASKPTLNSPISGNRLGLVNGQGQTFDNSSLTKIPLEQSSKKTKLFDDDDDDMPEWCPPKLHNQLSPQRTTTNFQKLPLCPPPPPPPLPPVPPPPRADAGPVFSYQPFKPAINSTPPTFMGAPPLPPPPPPPQLLQRPPPPQPLHQPPPQLLHRPLPPSQPLQRTPPHLLQRPPPQLLQRPPPQPLQWPPQPPPSRFNSDEPVWHPPGSFKVNPSFQSLNRWRT